MTPTVMRIGVGTLLIVRVLACAGSAQAQTATATKQKDQGSAAGLPLLLDRELFFGNPEISGAQISPDGQFLAFIKPYKDTRNIWVKRTDEPFDKAKPLTDDTKRPIPGYFWSRDGKYILFVQDQGGDENYNVYAVNPADAPAPGRDVAASRNLTAAKGVRAIIADVPRGDPDTLYVGLNDRDAAWHDLYKVKISTGERTLLRKNTERIASWLFDNAGNLRFAIRLADNGDYETLRVDESGFTKVYSCSVLEQCGPTRVHKDGRLVYMVTNKGDADLMRLTLFDPATGKEELVASDPMNRVDLTSARFSDVTDELIATIYVDERVRIDFKAKAFETDYNFLKKQLPDRDINLGSLTKDERTWVITASSDTEPGETYLFDRKTKTLTKQYRIREKLPREALASMKPLSYPSSDGLQIPAYLTLPKGVSPKNLPVIVHPHGGPWARDVWGYNSIVQFLANRGYAVLQPNFRGSTGYGKKFLNAGNNQWGDKMQDDITWGVKHIVAQGIADPKRIGIFGGSYGGYATLAGVTFTPDLYAAAVPYVAPSNIITLMESFPAYWEAGKKIWHTRTGDPTTPEGRKQLERQSPLTHAQKIQTPMLVVHGANDPRVKKAESDRIVISLRDRGFPVEYIVAPDEGHGFARPVNNSSMYAAMEKFFAKHLSGRFQEDMTPEAAARLKEITVNPKMVEMPKRVDLTAVSAPKPAVDLAPGTFNYKSTIATGTQTMSLTTSTAIKEESGVWVVTETAKTPMGEIVDTTVLEKVTLALAKRSVRQGPVAIDLEFKDNKATGTMAMSGQSKPVSVDLGGALFADGAGALQAIAALPLADGYSTTIRNFDLQKQKVALKQLKVAGTEEVTVPAGTFKAWKVEISSAEGDAGTQTVWVATDSRKPVKLTASLPQMGGAMLTSELQP
jgi:dipeptidyl aminopeptidase/acylaminoacyl peptidase